MHHDRQGVVTGWHTDEDVVYEVTIGLPHYEETVMMPGKYLIRAAPPPKEIPALVEDAMFDEAGCDPDPVQPTGAKVECFVQVDKAFAKAAAEQHGIPYDEVMLQCWGPLGPEFLHTTDRADKLTLTEITMQANPDEVKLADPSVPLFTSGDIVSWQDRGGLWEVMVRFWDGRIGQWHYELLQRQGDRHGALKQENRAAAYENRLKRVPTDGRPVPLVEYPVGNYVHIGGDEPDYSIFEVTGFGWDHEWAQYRYDMTQRFPTVQGPEHRMSGVLARDLEQVAEADVQLIKLRDMKWEPVQDGRTREQYEADKRKAHPLYKVDASGYEPVLPAADMPKLGDPCPPGLDVPWCPLCGDQFKDGVCVACAKRGAPQPVKLQFAENAEVTITEKDRHDQPITNSAGNVVSGKFAVQGYYTPAMTPIEWATKVFGLTRPEAEVMLYVPDDTGLVGIVAAAFKPGEDVVLGMTGDLGWDGQARTVRQPPAWDDALQEWMYNVGKEHPAWLPEFMLSAPAVRAGGNRYTEGQWVTLNTANAVGRIVAMAGAYGEVLHVHEGDDGWHYTVSLENTMEQVVLDEKWLCSISTTRVPSNFTAAAMARAKATRKRWGFIDVLFWLAVACMVCFGLLYFTTLGALLLQGYLVQSPSGPFTPTSELGAFPPGIDEPVPVRRVQLKAWGQDSKPTAPPWHIELGPDTDK